MSSCRTETLDVTGACCKKLRSELAGPFELRLAIGSRAAITGLSGSGKASFFV